MTEAPEKIWVFKNGFLKGWSSHGEGHLTTEYTRSDIADTLRAEVARLRLALVAALAVYDAAELRDGEPPEATQAINSARTALAHGEAD
tara:strand:- start:44 stop:310 length:267 start_codon:yes stop_codon:yes gene_type:complete